VAGVAASEVPWPISAASPAAASLQLSLLAACGNPAAISY